MSPREIVRQVARTAAMALGGAAVLLLLLHVLSGFPNGHLLIVLALATPLGSLFGWVALTALRSGELPYRFGVDRRDTNPVAFWTSLVIFAAGSAGLAAISLWSLAQVIAGVAA